MTYKKTESNSDPKSKCMSGRNNHNLCTLPGRTSPCSVPALVPCLASLSTRHYKAAGWDSAASFGISPPNRLLVRVHCGYWLYLGCVRVAIALYEHWGLIGGVTIAPAS